MSQPHEPAHRVVVVIPTYNEAGNVETILGRTRAAAEDLPPGIGLDVLVVDDNSPDGTGALADRRAAADAAIHVLHRAGKAGLGAAYIAGFRWAMERDYDVVVEMDADGSHAPEELHRLLARIEAGADLVIGARWVPGGRVIGWSVRRRLLSRAANTYARLLLRIPLHDATGGFRAYRTGVLRALPLGGIASEGYCFQVDMAWQAWRAGFRVEEEPISFTERQYGSSKMSASIVVEALYRIFRWGLSARTGWLRRLIGYRPRTGGES